MKRRTGLFLIELITAILFFALSSAICLRLFAFAHTTTAYNSDMGSAVTAAQNTAECFKAAGGDLGLTAELLGMYNPDIDAGSTLTFKDAHITLRLTAEPADTVVRAEITVFDRRNKRIFGIDVTALRTTGVTDER